jgi:murein DD-endopeptidase MepM/ murein hydrolase activator NlpD
MPIRQASRKIWLAELKPKGLALPVLLASLILFGCGPAAVSLPKKRPPGIYHVVRSGENLFRIGKAYDIPFQELARINAIADIDRIRAGQRIFVPGATRQLPVDVITPAETGIGAPEETEADRNGFIWPLNGVVASPFGPRRAGFHDGVDIAAEEGTPIRAVEDGDVVFSNQLRGYGNIVIIRHPRGFASVYSHNRKNLVREGQRVSKGDIIAEVGSTGRVTAPHLHFEIRKNNIARNPLDYLPKCC